VGEQLSVMLGETYGVRQVCQRVHMRGAVAVSRLGADVLAIPPHLTGVALPTAVACSGATVVPPAPTMVSGTVREGGGDPVPRKVRVLLGAMLRDLIMLVALSEW
jgi:hypothetical protein